MDPLIEPDWLDLKNESLEEHRFCSGNVAKSWQWRERGINPSYSSNAPSNKTVLENVAEDILVQKKLSIRSCDLPGYPRSTFLMVFSPDGTKVASTHGNHNVYVSELASGKHLRILKGHPRTPWCIAFHPSHAELIASGCLGGQVRVWDLSGSSEVWTVENETVIASIAFHPRDQLLVIATFNELYFWDWSRPVPFTKVCTNNINEKVRFVGFDSLGYKLVTGISSWPPPGANITLLRNSTHGSNSNSQLNLHGDSRNSNSPTAQELIVNSYQTLVRRYDNLVRNYHRLFTARYQLNESPTHTTDRGTDPMETDSSGNPTNRNDNSNLETQDRNEGREAEMENDNVEIEGRSLYNYDDLSVNTDSSNRREENSSHPERQTSTQNRADSDDETFDLLYQPTHESYRQSQFRRQTNSHADESNRPSTPNSNDSSSRTSGFRSQRRNSSTARRTTPRRRVLYARVKPNTTTSSTTTNVTTPSDQSASTSPPLSSETGASSQQLNRRMLDVNPLATQTINESLDLIRDILRDSGTRLLNLITSMSLSTLESVELSMNGRNDINLTQSDDSDGGTHPRGRPRSRLLSSSLRREFLSSGSDSDSDNSTEVHVFRTRNSLFSHQNNSTTNRPAHRMPDCLDLDNNNVLTPPNRSTSGSQTNNDAPRNRSFRMQDNTPDVLSDELSAELRKLLKTAGRPRPSNLNSAKDSSASTSTETNNLSGSSRTTRSSSFSNSQDQNTSMFSSNSKFTKSRTGSTGIKTRSSKITTKSNDSSPLKTRSSSTMKSDNKTSLQLSAAKVRISPRTSKLIWSWSSDKNKKPSNSSTDMDSTPSTSIDTKSSSRTTPIQTRSLSRASSGITRNSIELTTTNLSNSLAIGAVTRAAAARLKSTPQSKQSEKIDAGNKGAGKSVNEEAHPDTDVNRPSTSRQSDLINNAILNLNDTNNSGESVSPDEAFKRVKSGVKALIRHTTSLTDLWIRGSRVPYRELRIMWDNLRRRVLALQRQTGQNIPSHYTRSISERCRLLTEMSRISSSLNPNRFLASENINASVQTNASSTPDVGRSGTTPLGRWSPRLNIARRNSPATRRRLHSSPRWRQDEDSNRLLRQSSFNRFCQRHANRLGRTYTIRSLELQYTRNEIRVRAMEVLSIMFNMMMSCLEQRGLSQLIIYLLRSLKKALGLTCLLLMTNRFPVSSDNTNSAGDRRDSNPAQNPSQSEDLGVLDGSAPSTSQTGSDCYNPDSKSVCKKKTEKNKSRRTTGTTSINNNNNQDSSSSSSSDESSQGESSRTDKKNASPTPEEKRQIEKRKRQIIDTFQAFAMKRPRIEPIGQEIPLLLYIPPGPVAQTSNNTPNSDNTAPETAAHDRESETQSSTNDILSSSRETSNLSNQNSASGLTKSSQNSSEIKSEEPKPGPSSANEAGPSQSNTNNSSVTVDQNSSSSSQRQNNYESKQQQGLVKLAELHAIRIRNAARNRVGRLQTFRFYTLPTETLESLNISTNNEETPQRATQQYASPNIGGNVSMAQDEESQNATTSNQQEPTESLPAHFEAIFNSIIAREAARAYANQQPNEQPQNDQARAAPRAQSYLQPIILAQNSLVIDDEGGPGGMGGLLDTGLVPDVLPAPTHRVQAWDFTQGNAPNIADSTKNVVVQKCRIHNDASIDISKDGRLLVALLPTVRHRNTNHRLGVYSLEWNRLGQCLHTASLEQSAVSVALSPTARYLAVGLGSRRFVSISQARNNVFAVLFKLDRPGHSTRSPGLAPIKELKQNWEYGFTSLNCLRWAPHPGQGLVYANNTGQLVILS